MTYIWFSLLSLVQTKDCITHFLRKENFFSFSYEKLIDSSPKMTLIDYFSILDSEDFPPTKAYVHSLGFKDVYQSSVAEARSHLEESLRRIGKIDRRELVRSLPHHPIDTSYFICILWGIPDSSKKVIDCSGYTNYTGWPGNPDQYSFVLQRVNTCGDGVIVLGMEEEHRRKTRGLKEFLKEGIDLRELNRRIQPRS